MSTYFYFYCKNKDVFPKAIKSSEDDDDNDNEENKENEKNEELANQN